MIGGPPLVRRTRSRGTRCRFTVNDTGELPIFFPSFFFSPFFSISTKNFISKIKSVTNILLYSGRGEGRGRGRREGLGVK